MNFFTARWTLAGLLATLSLANLFGTTATDDTPADIGAILESVIARNKIPGMAAVVLRGDHIIAQGVAGVRKKGTTVPVQISDQFAIASCTKAMTATLVAIMVDEGKLSWNTTLQELFGNAVRKMKPAWKNVTVRQLLDHRAGLSNDHLPLLLPGIAFSKKKLPQQRLNCVKKLLSREPDVPPGSKFTYTSAAYVVLGAALEKISGQSWEDLMQSRLFQPLQMASAGFGPPGTRGRIDQPWGHGYRFYSRLFGICSNDTPINPSSYWADVPRAAGPAGLAHMSVADWAKFITLQLRADPANPHHQVSLLKPDTIGKLNEADPSNDVPRAWGGGQYAAGWVVTKARWAKGPRPDDVGRILWHQGDNSRWNSAVVMAPEIDLAVLVVCNRAYMWGPSSDAVAALIEEFAPEPGIPGEGLDGNWQGSLRGTLAGGLRFTVEIAHARSSKPEATLVGLDQGNERVPITKLTENDGVIHLETQKGGIFDGKVSADGAKFSGIWKQGSYVRWVVFRRTSQ